MTDKMIHIRDLLGSWWKCEYFGFISVSLYKSSLLSTDSLLSGFSKVRDGEINMTIITKTPANIVSKNYYLTVIIVSSLQLAHFSSDDLL